MKNYNLLLQVSLRSSRHCALKYYNNLGMKKLVQCYIISLLCNLIDEELHNFILKLHTPTFRHRNSNQSVDVLQCLPYFFLIGQPKCATTDIFYRIGCHPDVAEPPLKGPHWWSRKRFGKVTSPKA